MTPAPLWNRPISRRESFRWSVAPIILQRQVGPTCVATCLAMLTDQDPECFCDVNIEDPVAWSKALEYYSLKLAYCPTDFRAVRCYAPELIEHDDVFLLGYYCDWPELSPSHLVIWDGRTIVDPSTGRCEDADFHSCMTMPTKRIFRVVTTEYAGGL